NDSPDGMMGYRPNACGGAERGKLLGCEYSAGDDIAVLTVDGNGNVVGRPERRIAGLRHFTDPLDLTEDTSNGFLYVAEFGGQKLTLVRPIVPGARIDASRSLMAFNDINRTGASPAVKL